MGVVNDGQGDASLLSSHQDPCSKLRCCASPLGPTKLNAAEYRKPCKI